MLESDHLGKNIVEVKVSAKASGIEVNFAASRCYHYLSNYRELKIYPRCKTVTSQNVLSEAQLKNFFVSYKNYVPFWRYSSFCIFSHPMIYEICDVTMGITTSDRMHFWSIGQLIDISKGNIFLKSFGRFGGLELRSRPFSS